MTFQIIWSKPAIRNLKTLGRSVARRIFEKASELTENPHRFVLKLVNSASYRLRVGVYRVMLDVRDDVLRILVLKVGHRESVCDG